MCTDAEKGSLGNSGEEDFLEGLKFFSRFIFVVRAPSTTRLCRVCVRVSVCVFFKIFFIACFCPLLMEAATSGVLVKGSGFRTLVKKLGPNVSVSVLVGPWWYHRSPVVTVLKFPKGSLFDAFWEAGELILCVE